MRALHFFYRICAVLVIWVFVLSLTTLCFHWISSLGEMASLTQSGREVSWIAGRIEISQGQETARTPISQRAAPFYTLKVFRLRDHWNTSLSKQPAKQTSREELFDYRSEIPFQISTKGGHFTIKGNMADIGVPHDEIVTLWNGGEFPEGWARFFKSQRADYLKWISHLQEKSSDERIEFVEQLFLNSSPLSVALRTEEVPNPASAREAIMITSQSKGQFKTGIYLRVALYAVLFLSLGYIGTVGTIRFWKAETKRG